MSACAQSARQLGTRPAQRSGALQCGGDNQPGGCSGRSSLTGSDELVGEVMELSPIALSPPAGIEPQRPADRPTLLVVAPAKRALVEYLVLRRASLLAA